MWDKVKDFFKSIWVWVVIVLSGAAALFFALFRSEKAQKEAIAAVAKADQHAARAEVFETQATAKEQEVLPMLEKAAEAVDVKIAEVKQEAAAKVEAGKNDDAKALVEEFRRAGY